MVLATAMIIAYIPLVLWAYAEIRTNHNNIHRVRSYDNLY